MSFAVEVIAAAVALSQIPAVPPPGPLTLEQAADIAARNAFAVRLQASRVEQARQQVEEAKAGLLPQVNGSLSVSRLPQAQTATVGGPGTPPVVIQPAETRSITGSISFPIDVFGNQHRRIDAGLANVRASRSNLAATQNDARLNAKTSYLGVLRADAAVAVARQAVTDAQERVEQARLLLSGDQIARVDVTRLEAQLDANRAELAVARNNQQIQRNAFNLALALPIERPVEVVDIAALPGQPDNVDSLVQRAQTDRPEVQALANSIEAIAKNRRALEASLNPSVAFGVNYQRNLDAGAFAQKEQTLVSLQMSIPIFDGGATRARVRAARQDEEQAKINLAQTQLAISQEVRNASVSLVNARARLASAQSQVTAAEEVYRLAKVRQSAGEGTYVEVVDALTQLVQARNAVISAKYDYLVAYSQLQRAVGTDDFAASTPAAGGSPR